MTGYRDRSSASVLSFGLRFVLGIVGLCFSAPYAMAAPLYDMSTMLGETHPFLLAPPPAPAETYGVPPMPALGSNVPPVAAPRSGSGPMMMPQTLGPSAGSRQVQGQKAMSASAPETMPQKSKPFISEVRLGALAHDQGPFSSNKEEGYDANFEILFSSPDFLKLIWSPRPHIGATYNAYGDTSQAYLGLTWEWDFFEDFFAGFSLGGAVHNGETSTLSLDKKELGCRVLFRESITLGYRINKTHSLMAFMDHISNAKLCSSNEGLENVGIRYGYRF